MAYGQLALEDRQGRRTPVRGEHLESEVRVAVLRGPKRVVEVVAAVDVEALEAPVFAEPERLLLVPERSLGLELRDNLIDS